ncbi:MAG: amidohydrolase family protein [Lentisphaeria bacterium]|nr:amidohydrolase family protein [Lentisphaeria bacterium]
MMKYIDAHAHAYRKPLPFVTRFCTPDELIERYDRYGIEMGALLPVVNSEIYLPQANEDILDMAEAHPDRFFPFCNVDPRALINRADAQLDTVLQYYKDLGCKGVGEIMPNLPFEDELVQNLFRCAEKVGLPVTTDGSDRIGGDFGLCDAPGLPGLEHTLQRFPNLKFIAHGPIFWAELTRNPPAARKPVFRTDGLQSGAPRLPEKIEEEGAAAALLRTFPNLYGELSDGFPILSRDEDFAVRFLTEFQDRLFFGTDSCNSTCDANYQIKLWFDNLHGSGRLPEGVWKKICRNNAIDFFRLDLPKA